MRADLPTSFVKRIVTRDVRIRRIRQEPFVLKGKEKPGFPPDIIINKLWRETLLILTDLTPSYYESESVFSLVLLRHSTKGLGQWSS